MQTFVNYFSEGLRQFKLQILAFGYNMEMMEGATSEANKDPFISGICFLFSFSVSLCFLASYLYRTRLFNTKLAENIDYIFQSFDCSPFPMSSQ